MSGPLLGVVSLASGSFPRWEPPVSRLIGAVLRFKLSQRRSPSSVRTVGTSAGALRSWMKSKGFEAEVDQWKWSHPFAQVTVDCSAQPSPHNLKCLVGLAQHNVRVGWLAWVFQRWYSSNRRPLFAFGLPIVPVTKILLVTHVRFVFGAVAGSGSGTTSSGRVLLVLVTLPLVLLVLT